MDGVNLEKLARNFGVSEHAMMIRLVSLRYVSRNHYWKSLRSDIVNLEKRYKGGGRSKYYAQRYIRRVGRFYTNLVINAMNAGVISAHSAGEHLGIKNPQHLLDILKHKEFAY